jgi:hypothetical protein
MRNELLSGGSPMPPSGKPWTALDAATPFRCSACDYPKGTESGWCGRCHWFTAGSRG